MVPTELIEELRGTWGPAPVDPERRVLWNEDLELLAQVPALLAKKVKDEGTPHTSLIRDFGSLEQLSFFEAECIEQFLADRTPETLHELVTEMTEEPLWSNLFGALNRVQKSRLRTRLTEDVLDNLTLVMVSLRHPEVMRRLFSLH